MCLATTQNELSYLATGRAVLTYCTPVEPDVVMRTTYWREKI
jgi:hypothetical protein